MCLSFRASNLSINTMMSFAWIPLYSILIVNSIRFQTFTTNISLEIFVLWTDSVLFIFCRQTALIPEIFLAENAPYITSILSNAAKIHHFARLVCSLVFLLAYEIWDVVGSCLVALPSAKPKKFEDVSSLSILDYPWICITTTECLETLAVEGIYAMPSFQVFT